MELPFRSYSSSLASLRSKMCLEHFLQPNSSADLPCRADVPVHMQIPRTMLFAEPSKYIRGNAERVPKEVVFLGGCLMVKHKESRACMRHVKGRHTVFACVNGAGTRKAGTWATEVVARERSVGVTWHHAFEVG